MGDAGHMACPRAPLKTRRSLVKRALATIGRKPSVLAGAAGVALLAGLALGARAYAQQAGSSANGAAGADLGAFWPADAASRQWKVVARTGATLFGPRRLMWIRNQTTGPGQFTLWYYGKKSQAPGEETGELYRLCRAEGRTWVVLDGYRKTLAGKQVAEHRVMSDRVLFTPGGQPAIDLIADGSYRACGARGQPYLVWAGAPHQYRIQVWGHLAEAPQDHWYWDASVNGPESVVDDCMAPAAPRLAIRVREAWWDDFKDRSGIWHLGSGATDPESRLPTGEDVTYGRTVWHGAGGLPYLMIGPGPRSSNPRWCVDEVGAPTAN